MDLLDSAFALVPSEIMNDAFLSMQLKPVLARKLEAASQVGLCSTFMAGVISPQVWVGLLTHSKEPNTAEVTYDTSEIRL